MFNSLIPPLREFLNTSTNRSRRSLNVSSVAFIAGKYLMVCLFGASLLSSSFQFLGSPISCHLSEHEKLDKKTFESFCWMQGAHIVVPKHEASTFEDQVHGRVPEQAPAQGVEPHHPAHDEDLAIRYQTYYQWICFVLLLEGILAYFPHWLWKYCEGNRIKRMAVKDIFTDNVDLKDVHLIARCFQSRRKICRSIFNWYMFCSLVGLATVLIHATLLNELLGGYTSFWGLGFSAADISEMYYSDEASKEVEDVLEYVFPRLSKCEFRLYGPSGSEKVVDGICTLPINALYQKIYLAVWFALFSIFILYILTFLWYFVASISSELRVRMLETKLPPGVSSKAVLSAIPSYGVSEWFVLLRLSDVLLAEEFEEFMYTLSNGRDRESRRNLIGLREEEEDPKITKMSNRNGYEKEATMV